MTFQRLIRRNHLDDGNYDVTPQQWHRMKSVIHPDYRDDVTTLQGVLEHYNNRVEHNNNQIKMFVGDLRRLERDARDEQGICQRISDRTKIEPDVVAAVLKEFFDL